MWTDGNIEGTHEELFVCILVNKQKDTEFESLDVLQRYS